jgi:hypothetical protein
MAVFYLRKVQKIKPCHKGRADQFGKKIETPAKKF